MIIIISRDRHIFLPLCFAGDLLENYCWEDILMNFARFAFAITIMLTYPVECFVTREVQCALLKETPSEKASQVP